MVTLGKMLSRAWHPRCRETVVNVDPPLRPSDLNGTHDLTHVGSPLPSCGPPR